MGNWDPQMMLDLYIHNYLTKKNMHSTAELFAREADIYPQPVAIDPPEGFLSEWWSIFWSTFEHTVQDNNGTGPSNFNPAMPSQDFSYMLQNMSPTMPPGFPNIAGSSMMQTLEINNLFESDYSRTMMPMPNNENLLGSNLPGMMMPRPENRNLLGTIMPRPENMNLLGSDFSRTMMPVPENGLLGSDILRTMMLRPENMNLLGSDFSRTMMPVPENVTLIENGLPRTMMPGLGNGNLLGSDISRTMMPRPENMNFLGSGFPRMMMPRLEDGSLLGSKFSGMMMPMPENRSFPGSDIPTMNSNSQSMNIDQLVSMLPSSSNLSYQREKVYANPQLCLTRGDKCGSSFRRSTAAAGPSNLSQKTRGLKLKSLETDSRIPAKKLNFNSQFNDSFVHSLASSINFSHSPPEKVPKKPHQQLSLICDDNSGTRFCSSAAAEPARFMPDARRVFEPERSWFLGVGRAAPLPSGSNLGGTKKNKKQRQLPVAGGKRYGVGLKRSTPAEPAQLAPKDTLPKIEPADDTDARAFEQVHLGPPGMEFDSNLQPEDIDQLPLLLGSPSNHCSSPQQNVTKNGKLPVTQDDGCDNNLERATDVEPTDPAPKVAIQPAKTGSSSSSNSESSDPSS